MQLLIRESMPRKPRAKRDTVAITFRISPATKRVISLSSEEYGRSENQQAEFLLKIGYLYSKGKLTMPMSDLEILEKFEEISEQLEEDQDD